MLPMERPATLVFLNMRAKAMESIRAIVKPIHGIVLALGYRSF